MNSIILRQAEARELYEKGSVEITRDVKPQPAIEIRQDHPEITEVIWQDANGLTNAGGGGDVLKYLAEQKCPYVPGAVLRVREAWLVVYRYSGERINVYMADGIPYYNFLTAARMPLSASRASVRVVSVDVVQSEGKWQWKIKLEKVRKGGENID